jgi:hypothetical protein
MPWTELEDLERECANDEPDADQRTEHRQRWERIREAKLAKVRTPGPETVDDTLNDEEMTAVLGDECGGLTSWERGQRRARLQRRSKCQSR